MILLEAVSRHFEDGERGVRALDGIDLSVARGETVALMGRSGSGKSTLLHLVGGLDWPSAGRVTVAGQPLHKLSDEALTALRLRTIGFVFQFFHLVPTLTVLENLTLPAELAGLGGRERRRRARALAEAVGVAGRLTQYPDRLSGGEQQRIAIARGLMLDPPLLLADEPTGNLDSETGSQVLSLLFALARQRGMTLVMATHSEEAARLARRRIVLRDGRVASDSGEAAVTSGASGPAAAATS
jgi:putative ABC transport system ATP-binding protein